MANLSTQSNTSNTTLNDTICAIATGANEAAIALIRISGPKAIPIVTTIFSNHKFVTAKGQTLHFGNIHSSNGAILDEVLVSKFVSPNSYTSEDLVEISCHGSEYIQQKIVELILTNGARMAKHGEFTQRAYLNGKLDLSQAEAVADLIASKSEKTHELALQQMRGGYSKKIKVLRSKLIDFASLIELELDFSEEDVEFADRSALISTLEELISLISKIKNSFELGNAIKKGIPVAIVGAPNVGKSTLLNTLIEQNKAIVTDIAGTTRDVIEDSFVINGVSFRFIDTAGIRNTKDKVEKLGIDKTYEMIKEAQIVLSLMDGESGFLVEKQQLEGHQKLIKVFNKVDSIKNFQTKNDIIAISAQEKINIQSLKNKLIEVSKISELNNHDIVVSNGRHYEALHHSGEHLQKTLEDLKMGISGDLVAISIKRALYHLGEITGEVSSDDLLGNIFGRFCIGK